MYPWIFGWLDDVPNIGAAIVVAGLLALAIVVGVELWNRL